MKLADKQDRSAIFEGGRQFRRIPGTVAKSMRVQIPPSARKLQRLVTMTVAALATAVPGDEDNTGDAKVDVTLDPAAREFMSLPGQFLRRQAFHRWVARNVLEYRRPGAEELPHPLLPGRRLQQLEFVDAVRRRAAGADRGGPVLPGIQHAKVECHRRSVSGLRATGHPEGGIRIPDDRRDGPLVGHPPSAIAGAQPGSLQQFARRFLCPGLLRHLQRPGNGPTGRPHVRCDRRGPEERGKRRKRRRTRTRRGRFSVKPSGRKSSRRRCTSLWAETASPAGTPPGEATTTACSSAATYCETRAAPTSI